ncbi:hypothetical protein OIO90_002093 [Microbotryomycetes sp. JL221]|nr:hypothetical protein OIO90_002093 [Microbotryomycetes sp. JL221]
MPTDSDVDVDMAPIAHLGTPAPQVESHEQRYTTPTPDAARSLPTPHPQSPPTTPRRESIEAILNSQRRGDSPSPRKIRRVDPQGLVVPVAALTMMQTPDQKLDSSMGGEPTRAVPSTPTSPAVSGWTRSTIARKMVPLCDCIPVGTIELDQHQVAEGAPVELAEDGWRVFRKGALDKKLGPRTDVVSCEPPNPPQEKPADTVMTTPKPKSKKSKRRQSVTKSPFKLPPSKEAGDMSLDTFVHLQDAYVVRLTFKAPDEASDKITCRIYLVPTDVDLLSSPDYAQTRRTRPADSTIINFFARINTNKHAWQADGTWDGSTSQLDLLDEKDQRSILELYQQVRSPTSDSNFVDALSDASDQSKDRIAAVLDQRVPGLKTHLYEYQAASLAKMLARELVPQYEIDPAFIERSSSIDGSEYWMSVRGVVTLEPPYVLEPKAGILAEEMGSGKTCICLALILATVRDLPDLEDTPTYLDGSAGSPDPTMMTFISRSFPFEREMALELSLLPRVPPPLLAPHEMDVLELAAYERALAEQDWQDSQRQRPPVPSLRNLMMHYVRTSTTAIHWSPDDSFLAGTSLPEELIDCNPFYNLLPSPVQTVSRTGRQGLTSQPTQIIVSCATLVVVPAELVTQWKDEISKHVEDKALRVLVLRTSRDEFKTAQQLAQYDLVLVSIKRFSDACDDASSPLRKVHWKRLIVDEGHALAGKNRLREFAESLRCECRWAISGTPSTNLRGSNTAAEGALFAHEPTVGGNEADYERLGKLISLFMRHRAFSEPSAWRQCFTDPILKSRRGAERLGRLFDNCIVRNGPEVLKRAYELPPLTSRIIHVDLNEAERKTYNALIGVFSSNAILSQREDEDYLFHPSQRRNLDQITENLAASSMLFASPQFFEQLTGSINRSKAELESDRCVNWSQGDRVALRKAIEVMQEALDDPEWHSVVGSVAVNLDVYGLDEALVKAYDGLSASLNPRQRTIMPLGSLVNLRRAVHWLRRSDNAKWKDDEDLVEELITHEDKRKREEMLSKSNKPVDKATDTPKKSRKKGELLKYLPLPAGSVFHKAELGSLSTSAKLNHVVGELRRYPDEKFIVFASSLPDLAFASLSEALDLLGIKHLIFTSHGKGKDRGAIAAKFNATTAKECQAILVDARLGGRGINLTAASRVIMLEPIWQPDLEVQAARRAHRLGQTKPVDLSVLVVPDTYEDAMLKRRSQLDPTGAINQCLAIEIAMLTFCASPLDFTSTTKLPQRDSQLQQLLQSAQYLEATSSLAGDSSSKRVRLFTDDSLPPLPSNSRSSPVKSSVITYRPSISPKHGPTNALAPVMSMASPSNALTTDCGASSMAGPSPKKIKKSVQFAF